MKGIVTTLVSVIGGWLGWWLGDFVGLFIAKTLGMIGTGFGIYFGKRIAQEFE